jgi:hypothetical protein
VTEDIIISREYQDCHKNEEPTDRGKSSASAEDGKTGSVGALVGEGKAAGRGN